MTTALCVLASVFTFVAIAIHFYIFYLELPVFGSEKFQKTFKTKPEHHEVLRPAFNNLGVYNGAIGMMTLIGCIGLWVAHSLHPLFGLALMGWASGMITCGLSIMLCAGAYLFFTSPDKRRAACIQALPPMLALVYGLIAVAIESSIL